MKKKRSAEMQLTREAHEEEEARDEADQHQQEEALGGQGGGKGQGQGQGQGEEDDGNDDYGGRADERAFNPNAKAGVFQKASEEEMKKRRIVR